MKHIIVNDNIIYRNQIANNYTSAGTILISFENRKVLLIKHPEGHWGFPKGYIEIGETPFETAQRELLEEVGIQCNFYMNPSKYSFNEQYSFIDESGVTIEKRVIYFIGVTCNTEYVLETAFKNCIWINFSELYNIHNFKNIQIANQVEHLAKREICWVKGNVDYCNMNEKIMSSKHVFSRVIPLVEYSSNIKIKNAPNIMDSYFMYEIIKKSKALRGNPMILHEDDVNRCWSSVNIIPFLVFNHSKLILECKPSGCSIGQRSIDLYLNIMEQFGIEIKKEEMRIMFIYNSCKCDIDITLPFPSFTGTSMAIYCAMLNNHKTHLANISLEPEIIFLISQIRLMGWDIRLEGRDLYISRLSDIIPHLEIEIPEDRNVLVTRIVDSLINNERFSYKSQHRLYLSSLLHYFDNIGIKYEYDHTSIVIYENQLGKMKQSTIICDHYPDLCSDWQPLLAYLSLQNSGKVTVKDKVFENRFKYFEQIASVYDEAVYSIDDYTMTAQIGTKFNENIPSELSCLDIRASAVLFMMAEDNVNFVIRNLTQLLRGYSSLDQISPQLGRIGNFEFV